MFLIGLIGAGLPLVLGAQAPTLLLLLVTMFVAGLGNAVALPPTTRAIIYWFPLRSRGLAMGIKQTGVALAGAIMGLVVPQLAPGLGWRSMRACNRLSGCTSWMKAPPESFAGRSMRGTLWPTKR